MGPDQAVQQQVQPATGDGAGRLAQGRQDVANGTYRAGGTVRHVPGVAPVGVQRFVQHGFGGNFCDLEGLGRELAVGEIFHRPGHAAHAVRGDHVGVVVLAQDHFGGTPTDVHHQAALVGLRQQV